MGFPPASSPGEPEVKSAVETSAAVEAPKPAAVKPVEAPAKAEGKPADVSTVNFDGLSDQSKAFWEKALKAGHATPADVARAQEESLFKKFQPTWSKRNEEIATARKAVAAEREVLEKDKADLALLHKIRESEHLLSVWDKFVKGDVPPEESGDGLVDEKKAAEIARKAVESDRKASEARERERAERTAKEQAAYVAARGEIQTAIQGWMAAEKVAPDVAAKYLHEEELALKGVDPILHYGDSPQDLIDRVQRRHERATLLAENAALKEQLTSKVSKQVQSSKQSLSPSVRVADTLGDDPWSKTMKEMNVAQDMSNVTGIGWQGNGR